MTSEAFKVDWLARIEFFIIFLHSKLQGKLKIPNTIFLTTALYHFQEEIAHQKAKQKKRKTTKNSAKTQPPRTEAPTTTTQRTRVTTRR